MVANANKAKILKKKNSEIFIEDAGYFLENHEVQTEDGYILTISRLLKRSEAQNEKAFVKNKPVALLVHGLMCSGDHWCMISPEDGLPYKLVNEGYDVWMPNLRGCPLSRKHISLSTDSKKFWDFSFHELGVFDLPAIIHHVLEVSGQERLVYIGHSMGCSIFFVLLSMKPEYTSKITAMFALAPAVYGKSIQNIAFRQLITFGNFMGASKFIRRREIGNVTVDKVMRYVTPKSKRDKFGGWCLRVLGGRSGIFGKGIDTPRLRTLSKEWPAPTSAKLLFHGVQCLKSNKPRQYNYGRSGNLRVYGQTTPPIYDLAKIQVPVATFCSDGDEICRPQDVTKLSKVLPNLIEHFDVKDRDFSHVDFMLGDKSNEFVFKRVIQTLTELKVSD